MTPLPVVPPISVYHFRVQMLLGRDRRPPRPPVRRPRRTIPPVTVVQRWLDLSA